MLAMKLNISRACEKYMQHKEKYPMIFFFIKASAAGGEMIFLGSLTGNLLIENPLYNLFIVNI